MIYYLVLSQFHLSRYFVNSSYLNVYPYVAVDTPDPYVKVHIPTSKCPSQKTVHKDNTHNPEWDEEFKFVVDPEVKNILSKPHIVSLFLFKLNVSLLFIL